MAYGLLERIYDHGFSEGWLHEGSVVVDCFGGICTTGILGAYRKVQVIAVELEEKFCRLGEQNLRLHDNAWRKLGCPRPVMIQGDSRQLSRILGIESGSDRNRDSALEAPDQMRSARQVSCIIASPPFTEQQSGGGIVHQADRQTKGRKNSGYQNQGVTDGNLGNLKPGDVEMILGSPPYQKSDSRGAGKMSPEYLKKFRVREEELHGKGHSSNKYIKGELHEPNSEGQLGQEQGDTFWQAAKLIVEQSYSILKPSGYAIWVVKAFVRNKKLVDFPGDWRRLCESVGFETLHEHHASLVKEDRKPSLFGPEIVKRKSKKSFFRRLCESKGSPAIDWETVFCMRKAGPI